MLNEETTWTKDTKLKKAIEVYDSAGNHVGYLINLIGKYKEAYGFIMVSAFLDDGPIIMWTTEGKSIDPEEIAEIDEVKNLKSTLDFSP